MSEARLIQHRGAREVPRGDLASIETPSPSRWWFPIGLDQVVSTVSTALSGIGFRVDRRG